MVDKEEDKYIVLALGETVAESIYKDTVTGTMIAFCVYISQNSTFWTFITGLMFLLFVFSKLSSIMLKRRHTFRTKKAMQEWIDELPEE